MRFILCACVIALFVMVSYTPSHAEASKYVEIKSPFANIYEYLDPKSTIIHQAKKGDHYELVYEGTSWYQVKTREKVGWLEKRAGEVVDSASYFSPLGIGIFIVLLIGTLGGVSFYIYKQRTAEV